MWTSGARGVPTMAKSRRSGARLFNVEAKFQAAPLQQAGATFARKVVEQVLRPGAYAGAKMIYDGMRLKVPVAQGSLRDAIYHWHDGKRSRPDRQIYLIGPNKKEAPHWHWIEFGHWLYNKSRGKDDWLRSKSNPNGRGPGAHDLPGAREERLWVGPKAFVRPTWDQYGRAALSASVVRMSVLFKEMK